jgi:hypothetical protein
MLTGVSTRPDLTAGTGLRWARGSALAAVAWCTASAAHVVAGGGLPPVSAVVALIALTAWPFTLSLRTRASGVRLAALLGAGQLMMHAAFVLIGSWTAAASLGTAPTGEMTGPSGHSGHEAGVARTGHLLPSSDPLSATMPPDHAMSLLPGPMMLLAHAAAAVLLGSALATGERALFSLLGLLRELARPVPRRVRPVFRVLAALLTGDGPAEIATAAARRARPETGARLSSYVLVRAVLRRGPPLFVPTFCHHG